ncbi:MAG TPA: helix-turn-helix domain-containing protein [Streptosporangiaceae bacterium]|nr:helix-turn-helix domain-containing protein [Streptosporangiaceae bacterium]
MLANVAAVVLDGFSPFELGVVCEVFGVDRTDDGLPAYDFAVVAGEPGPLRSEAGFWLHARFGLERLEAADLIAVPALRDRPDRRCREDFPDAVLAALRRCTERGGRVLSVCNGAFALGAAGLLDSRRCTTHWRHTEQLARRFPAAKIDPSVLYVEDGPVITSAGTAAGIDACLYLVRQEQGSRVANAIARRMVVPPHRDGGQAQYVERPVAGPATDTLGEVISWMERNLDQPATVRQLAARAAMSPRTFARRFVQETGTTPQHWLAGQRILLAQHLLEETDATIDVIAQRAGFGNATALRHHFRAWCVTTPHSYRRQFRGPSGAAAPGVPAASGPGRCRRPAGLGGAGGQPAARGAQPAEGRVAAEDLQ